MKHFPLIVATAMGAATLALAGCMEAADAQIAAPAPVATTPAPAAAPAPAPSPVAAPQRDAATLGRALFLQCAACHAVSASEPTKIGPHLAGIVGRPAGGVEGFGYSPALRASGIVWSREQLDAFLTRPASVVPGTSMAYGGIATPQQRAALIAYLETLR